MNQNLPSKRASRNIKSQYLRVSNMAAINVSIKQVNKLISRDIKGQYIKNQIFISSTINVTENVLCKEASGNKNVITLARHNIPVNRNHHARLKMINYQFSISILPLQTSW